MSKTPRVDAYMAANYSDAVFGHHLADFARQLEAENAALRACLKCLVGDGDRHFAQSAWPATFEPALSTARALLARVEGE